MSLPSEIYFLDSKGNTIHKDFINIGWHITGSGISDIIIDKIRKHKYHFDKCDYIWLYNCTFSKGFITSCESYNDLWKKIESYLGNHNQIVYGLYDLKVELNRSCVKYSKPKRF